MRRMRRRLATLAHARFPAHSRLAAGARTLDRDPRKMTYAYRAAILRDEGGPEHAAPATDDPQPRWPPTAQLTPFSSPPPARRWADLTAHPSPLTAEEVSTLAPPHPRPHSARGTAWPGGPNSRVVVWIVGPSEYQCAFRPALLSVMHVPPVSVRNSSRSTWNCLGASRSSRLSTTRSAPPSSRCTHWSSASWASVSSIGKRRR